jgi:MoxR-like ATPase
VSEDGESPEADTKRSTDTAGAINPPNPSPDTTRDPFARLGLIGFKRIAPVLIAALATEEPLLLVGPHGTAKSLLLTRVVAALGLECRHYNASLLNFDDLVGFPMPGRDGRLEYLKTPAAIWGAGAVIFDEVSRCRPEIQNKLFPIIHERRVQGLALDGLRYRWAAMNPPLTDDDDNGYRGSEPLDAALADRFAFVVEMPAWGALSEEEQLAVITSEDSPIREADAKHLAGVVARTLTILPSLRQSMAQGVGCYVRVLVALLAQAQIDLSPRRAAMLYRAILAVNAAALALDPGAVPAHATLLAVTHALPQRARGVAVSGAKLLAAHREAWRMASIAKGDPLMALLCTADPLERLRLAVASSTLAKDVFSQVIADALAQLPLGAREAAVVHLFETGAAGRLNAAVAGQAATLYRDVATPPTFSESVYASHPRFTTWTTIKDLLSRLDPREPRAHLRANALAAAFSRKEIATPQDAQSAFSSFEAADQRLGAA